MGPVPPTPEGTCGRCPDLLPDDGRCKPTSQKETWLWVHPECLPGEVGDILLHAGPGVGQQEVDDMYAHMMAEPADPQEPIRLSVVSGDTGAVGGSAELTRWDW